MREILFKAKRIDNGEWLEGVPVDVTPLTCFSSDSVKKEIVMVRAGFADWGMPRGIEGASVDPETVCQYTGLTDSNGVKIFEGDIVDMTGEWWDACGPAGHDSPITEVVWDDDVAGFFPFAKYDCDCGVYISASGCKVIGNIHDKED